MHVLVLGGTVFVGRHIVEALLRAGHTVTLLNRGRSADALPPTVERIRGDRDDPGGGLAGLRERGFDACVDVSGYTVAAVRASATALRDRVGRYVFVSAVSVYGDPPAGPVDERVPCVAPADERITTVDATSYGPLKVACEQVVDTIYGERATLLRPQVVAGAHDPWPRFSHWVRRAGLPGPMLAPGDGSDALQVIDAVDLAHFTVQVVETGLGGVFNLAGPRVTWAAFLQALGVRDAVWVPDRVLRVAGLTFNELPLFRAAGSARSSLMHVSADKAIARGLRLSPLDVTIARVRDGLRAIADPPLALPLPREAALIRAASPA